MATDTTTKLLNGVTGAFPASLYQLGKDDAMPADEYPLAQIIETLDGGKCLLCKRLHGMIVAKATAAYERWRLPSHIHCARIMVDIHKDEKDNEGNPTEADFVEPPKALVDAHGHFVNYPKTYEALRVPARPTGRDFIVSRDRETGARTLLFARALPDAMLRDTLRRLAGSIIGNATGGGPLYVGDHVIMRQCADQAVARGWFADLPVDAAHHRFDWGAGRSLSEGEYRDLPGEILQAQPEVSVCNYQHATYGETPLAVFHVPRVRVGQLDLPDASFLYDADRALVSHAGRLHVADFAAEPGYRVLVPGVAP